MSEQPTPYNIGRTVPTHETYPSKFQAVIAVYGQVVEGSYITKEVAMDIAEQAKGKLIDNKIDLGWPKQWRIVETKLKDTAPGQGIVIAECEPAEPLQG